MKKLLLDYFNSYFRWRSSYLLTTHLKNNEKIKGDFTNEKN